jgi:hypothetical protein
VRRAPGVDLATIQATMAERLAGQLTDIAFEPAIYLRAA